MHMARPMKLPIFATVLFTASSASANICYPGGNAELQACLAHDDLEKKLAPGKWLIDPTQPQVLINARDGLTIGPLNPHDPPKIECALAADERPVLLSSNNGITLRANGVPVTGVEVENLNFRNCSSGVATIFTGAGVFVDLSIHDLQVRQAYAAINLRGVKSAKIYGNHIVDADLGVSMPLPAPIADHVEITDNFIVGNPDQGSKFTNAGILVNNANGVIANNIIRHFTVFFGRVAAGITCGGRDSVGTFTLDILDNDIRDVEAGITLGGPSFAGTWVPFATALGRVEGNSIRDYDYHAITAFHGASGWTLGPNEYRDGPRTPFDNSEWNGDVLLMVIGGAHPYLSPTLFSSGASYITVLLRPGQTVANPVPSPTNTITVLPE